MKEEGHEDGKSLCSSGVRKGKTFHYRWKEQELDAVWSEKAK